MSKESGDGGGGDKPPINELKTRKLEAISAHRTPALEEFKDFAGEKTIKSDERYVKECKREFEEASTYHAKALETITQANIERGAILDDLQDSSYSTEAVWVTDYDDIRNRIDAAAIVHVKEKPTHSEPARDITFGIDLTTNPDPDVVRKKIIYGSNDTSLGYPVGFSRIKYCRDRMGNLSTQEYVPRYCIGISSNNVDNYLDTLIISTNSVCNTNKIGEDVISFKVLYEIFAQNDLFRQPLLDKLDSDKISEEEELALDRLEQLDAIYLKELTRIAKVLPDHLKKDAKTGKDLTIDEIAEKFISDEYLKDDTFAAIVTTSRNLLKEYDDNTDKNGGEPDTEYLVHCAEAYRPVRKEVGAGAIDTASKAS